MATVSTSPAWLARYAGGAWNSNLDPPQLVESSQCGVRPRYSASWTSCIPPYPADASQSTSFFVRLASATARPNACAWSISALSPGVFGPSARPTPTTQTLRTARESNERRRGASASIPAVLSALVHDWSHNLADLYDGAPVPAALGEAEPWWAGHGSRSTRFAGPSGG